MFHTRTRPSARAEASCEPELSKAMDHDPAVLLGREVLNGRGASGSATSHSWASGLSPVTARDRLSGLKATAWVMLGKPVSGGPRGCGVSPVVHRRTVRSSPPLARVRPSGLKDRVRAAAVWPRSTAVSRIEPVGETAYTVMVPSSDDAARVRPSAENRTM